MVVTHSGYVPDGKGTKTVSPRPFFEKCADAGTPGIGKSYFMRSVSDWQG